MKVSIYFLLLFTFFSTKAITQTLSPDKFIDVIKKEDSAYAFTIPGWLVRMGGSFAMNDMEPREQKILKELTSHIKKLRFVVSESLPENFTSKLREMQSFMQNNNYEQLIQVRDQGADVNLWAKFDGDKIKNLVISVLNSEDESVVINIKSDLRMDLLKEMKFFQDWNAL